jgi:hypothetical protein
MLAMYYILVEAFYWYKLQYYAVDVNFQNMLKQLVINI